MRPNCDTREKLLRVAFDLLWDQSYGSVSVDDICQRAEVNKGSFYHFFRTKADLASEAYQEHWRGMRPTFDQIFSAETPPLERIHRWCALVFDTQREKAERYGRVCGCPYATLGAELATQDEKMRTRLEELMQSAKRYLEEAIAEAIREGCATAVDPAVAAQRVFSLCLGMLVEARVRNDLDVLHGLEPAVMELIGATALVA
jgi:TetR/AcrR family transcriptional repressor of nem operon